MMCTRMFDISFMCVVSLHVTQGTGALATSLYNIEHNINMNFRVHMGEFTPEKIKTTYTIIRKTLTEKISKSVHLFTTGTT